MGIPQRLGTIPLAIFTDASNNIGIGGSPSGSFKFEVTGTTRIWDGTQGFNIRAFTAGAGYGAIYSTQVTPSNTNFALVSNGASTYLNATNDAGISIDNGTKGIFLVSTGNVGIGISSPSALLQTNQTGTTGYFYSGQQSGTEIAYWYYNASEVQFSSKASTRALTFLTNDTERMRITSGGNVLIGTTASFASGRFCLSANLNGENGIAMRNTSSLTGNYIVFVNQSDGSTGSISMNSSSTVLYVATSDYRLKEDLKEYNGLEIISKLKTYDFKWKEAGIRDYGMMAHELQEVLPSYVSGEKDAMNQDGTINPQGVDYSKLVPILIKGMQEQQSLIQELSAKVSALENK